MNPFTASLAVLIASSCLWIASASQVQAPKPVLKPLPAKAVLQIDCTKEGDEERGRVCRARDRLSKVKPRTAT